MNIYFVGALASVFFFIVAILSTNNWIIATAVCLICLVYFLFIASTQVKKHSKKIKAWNDSNLFINNFIISLSIQPVIEQAIDHAIKALDESYKDSLEGIEKLTGIEKIKYLTNYFPFHCYQLFIDVITLWQEQGGDILKMSNFLTNDIRETSEYINTCEQMGKKKAVEFSILWMFSLSVLVVTRFALSQFYELLRENSVYLVGVCVLFLFALFSFQILIGKITTLKVKGETKNGK